MAHDHDNSGVLRHVRHNFVVHALEGGLFLGGLTFVNFTTVLTTVTVALSLAFLVPLREPRRDG